MTDDELRVLIDDVQDSVDSMTQMPFAGQPPTSTHGHAGVVGAPTASPPANGFTNGHNTRFAGRTNVGKPAVWPDAVAWEKKVELPRLQPDFFLRLAEATADALCPAWRRDGVVKDSTGTTNKAARMDTNFNWWQVKRPAGLIRLLEVSWGHMAVIRHSDGDNTPPYTENIIPIAVEIYIDQSKVAVPGNKAGSTHCRLMREVGDVRSKFYKLDGRLFIFEKVGDCFD